MALADSLSDDFLLSSRIRESRLTDLVSGLGRRRSADLVSVFSRCLWCLAICPLSPDAVFSCVNSSRILSRILLLNLLFCVECDASDVNRFQLVFSSPSVSVVVSLSGGISSISGFGVFDTNFLGLF